MEVRILSDTLAVLDANALVDTLTKRLAELDVNTIGNKFSKLKADALMEITVLIASKGGDRGN